MGFQLTAESSCDLRPFIEVMEHFNIYLPVFHLSYEDSYKIQPHVIKAMQAKAEEITEELHSGGAIGLMHYRFLLMWQVVFDAATEWLIENDKDGELSIEDAVIYFS